MFDHGNVTKITSRSERLKKVKIDAIIENSGLRQSLSVRAKITYNKKKISTLPNRMLFPLCYFFHKTRPPMCFYGYKLGVLVGSAVLIVDHDYQPSQL